MVHIKIVTFKELVMVQTSRLLRYIGSLLSSSFQKYLTLVKFLCNVRAPLNNLLVKLFTSQLIFLLNKPTVKCLSQKKVFSSKSFFTYRHFICFCIVFIVPLNSHPSIIFLRLIFSKLFSKILRYVFTYLPTYLPTYVTLSNFHERRNGIRIQEWPISVRQV